MPGVGAEQHRAAAGSAGPARLQRQGDDQLALGGHQRPGLAVDGQRTEHADPQAYRRRLRGRRRGAPGCAAAGAGGLGPRRPALGTATAADRRWSAPRRLAAGPEPAGRARAAARRPACRRRTRRPRAADWNNAVRQAARWPRRREITPWLLIPAQSRFGQRQISIADTITPHNPFRCKCDLRPGTQPPIVRTVLAGLVPHSRHGPGQASQPVRTAGAWSRVTVGLADRGQVVRARHPDQLAARDPRRDRLVHSISAAKSRSPTISTVGARTSASRSKAGSASLTNASSAARPGRPTHHVATSGSAPAAARSRKLSARTASAPASCAAAASASQPGSAGQLYPVTPGQPAA